MISRRSLLVGAALAVGPVGVGVGGAASAAPGSRSRPQTIGAQRRVAGPVTVLRTDRVLSHIGVTWDAPDGSPRMRVRTADGWGEWMRLHGCSAGSDTSSPQDRAALVTTPVTIGYEIDHGGQALVAEIDAGDGLPGAASHARPGDIWAVLLGSRYRNSAAWGADESLRFDENGTNRYPDEFWPVQVLTVHHTVSEAPMGSDSAATVRAIYYNHTITRNFGDIGYHLLIDPDGFVYEGRSSGPDDWAVFGPAPGADGRPLMNNAAHTLAYNVGNIGVALIADLTAAQPTAAARESLLDVLSILARMCRLDPVGRADYANPVNGNQCNVDVISGHRDYLATECPGDAFYPRLPELRRDVAARLLVVPARLP